MYFVGYILFGIILFIISLVLDDKYKITRRDNFMFSIIYLIVAAGIFSRIGLNSFNDNIFMITVVELFCQLFYLSYFLDKDFLSKSEKYFSFYLSKIIVSFIINVEFINKVNDIFLSGNDLKIIIWFVILMYLVNTYKENSLKENVKDLSISKESIVVSFAKFKILYDDDIKLEGSKKLVIYAIMIFNNYKRPIVFRKLDNFVFKITNKPRKLGVMQVMSKKYINDYESIELVSKKIEKLYEKNKTDVAVINLYDKANCSEINYVYEELTKFCKL